MLLLNNLQFIRSDKVIFENINISASPGKTILIKGNNGSGKTTLLKTIINILEPSFGEVFWMGKKIKKNIFKFYSNTTLIMDKQTSLKELTIIENNEFYLWLKENKRLGGQHKIPRLSNSRDLLEELLKMNTT